MELFYLCVIREIVLYFGRASFEPHCVGFFQMIDLQGRSSTRPLFSIFF